MTDGVVDAVSSGVAHADGISTEHTMTGGESKVDEEAGVMEVEGLCMSCFKNGGRNRLLCVNIPHFKEVILMSFECPHCGYRNNEVQPAAQLAPLGRKYTLKLSSLEDLNRQVIKSESASFYLPVIDFEIPPSTQKSVATTVEGMLSGAATALEADQPTRRVVDAVTADKIQHVIDRIRRLATAQELPFTIVLDDPSGNSYIESLSSPTSINDTVNDPKLVVEDYQRSEDQLHAMGHFAFDAHVTESEQTRRTEHELPCDKVGALDLPSEMRPDKAETSSTALLKIHGEGGEVVGESENTPMSFETPCGHCLKLGKTHMVEMDIPGFRKCLLMAFTCEQCGARSSEVKAAGAYGEKGRKWTLKVVDQRDLNRDILKSDTAGVLIPELDFEATAGTQGGSFTTVEGLLSETAKHLEEKNPFVMGDSACDVEQRNKLRQLVQNLKKLASGEKEMLPFTLIIDDMADHSYIGSRDPSFKIEPSMAAARQRQRKNPDDNNSDKTTPDDLGKGGEFANDEQLVQTLYDRSDEQNDELGINDMRTENY